jgi:hypothetical protein
MYVRLLNHELDCHMYHVDLVKAELKRRKRLIEEKHEERRFCVRIMLVVLMVVVLMVLSLQINYIR